MEQRVEGSSPLNFYQNSYQNFCPWEFPITSLSVRESTSIILVWIGTKVKGSKVRLPRLLKLYCKRRKKTAVFTLHHSELP
jgi:hypothetical protein